MAVAWTISVNGGAATSVASLGILSGVRTRVSQDVGTLVLTFGTDFGTPVWGYKDIVEVFRDGSRWWYGPVTRRVVSAVGDEAHEIEVSDPWWFLEKRIYQQQWRHRPDDNPGTSTQDDYTARVLIGVDETGARVTTKFMMERVLDFAIAQGAPMARAVFPISVDTNLTVLPEERNTVTCAAVLREILRWHPQAVTWWDFSTMPYPTLNIELRADLPAVSVTLGTDELTGLQVRPLNEMVPGSVVIGYERTHDIDGLIEREITYDIQPGGATGLEDDAWLGLVRLDGRELKIQRQRINIDDYPDSEADINLINWLKSKVPNLTDLNNLEVVPGTLEIEEIVQPTDGEADPPEAAPAFSTATYGKELLSGGLESWMDEFAKPVLWRVRVRQSTVDAAGKEILGADNFADVAVQFTATTASKKVFSRVAHYSAGEAVPGGLASALWSQLQVLQYAGAVTLEREDVALTEMGPGNRLNLTAAGWPALATMGAMIQTAVDDMDLGRVALTFGYAGHLGPQDMLELMRANRRGRGFASFAPRETRDDEDVSKGAEKVHGVYHLPQGNSTIVTPGGGSVDRPFKVRIATDEGAGLWRITVDEGLIIPVLQVAGYDPSPLFQGTRLDAGGGEITRSTGAADETFWLLHKQTMEPVISGPVGGEWVSAGKSKECEIIEHTDAFKADTDIDETPTDGVYHWPLAKIVIASGTISVEQRTEDDIQVTVSGEDFHHWAT